MAICESTDFMFPLLADVFYPLVEQGAYGNVKKHWMLDRSVACFFAPGGRKMKQDVQPDVNITIDNSIIGRIKTDILTSQREDLNAITNVIVTNIRNTSGDIIYNESSGPRIGKATLFEVATVNPIINPFGSIEYYRVVLRRSENQAIDIW